MPSTAPTTLGQVLRPGDDGYEQARSGWLLTVEHHPALIVAAADPADVAAAVRYAAAQGLPVAVQSTGHGPSVPADDAVLITTGGLRDLSIDPHHRTARIGAGLRWGEVVTAAAAHGLAPLCGSSAQVGVMGFLTGGGLPLTGRTHGMAAAHVRSLDVVTADGRLRTVSPDREPDLFWAVRGGKSNFGVVVAAEIDLLPLTTIHGGRLHYPLRDRAHATHLITAYLDWARRQPEEMSSSITLMRLPDTPRLPEDLRGRSIAQIRVVHTGEEHRAAELLRPLRDLAPTQDTCATVPYTRITDIHQDPQQPVSVHLRSALLHDLDAGAAGELAAIIDPAHQEGPYAGIELRHLGGALDRPPARPHAAGTQGAAHHLWLRLPGHTEQARQAADTILRRLRPWDTGARLPGFLFDHDSTPAHVERAYTAPAYDRLTTLKAQYDPTGLFRITHTIPPKRG